ncbi:MAG: hypothetical protein LBR20_04535 [Propionibacteriaceae bacterium]|jgi:hypothetical protein|nr:hypothetical protein [Propionibacteriaceae bacterium]
MSVTTAELEAFFQKVSQGCVLALPAESPLLERLPEGTTHVTVASQTCDVVLPKRPTVIVAPVVTLTGDLEKSAARRDNPQFVPLPSCGQQSYADLAYLQAVLKADLFGLDVVPGIDSTNDEMVRTFGLSVGRWFSRFAFPDDLTPWLSPLVDAIREKYHHPASPLGMCLHDVVEIRVEAESWSMRPLNVTLHVVIRAGVIPEPIESDRPDTKLVDLAHDAEGYIRTPAEVAKLVIEAKDGKAKATLWSLLADSLAAYCVPKKKLTSTDALRTVAGIVAELWTDDTFPLSRVRKSELLDVDYLSTGYPL